MTSIRTDGLTKDFGDLRAVDNLNLDLPQGGVTGIVGPNGAGKSTTILSVAISSTVLVRRDMTS
jgi:ABC-2 type transport system ATP-binding protein